MRNDTESNTTDFDAALRLYDDLSMMVRDIGSSRIMHIVLTQGSLSFLHQTTRYNAAPSDYIILPNAALAQDFAASGDFEALLFLCLPPSATDWQFAPTTASSVTCPYCRTP